MGAARLMEEVKRNLAERWVDRWSGFRAAAVSNHYPWKSPPQALSSDHHSGEKAMPGVSVGHLLSLETPGGMALFPGPEVGHLHQHRAAALAKNVSGDHFKDPFFVLQSYPGLQQGPQRMSS